MWDRSPFAHVLGDLDLLDVVGIGINHTGSREQYRDKRAVPQKFRSHRLYLHGAVIKLAMGKIHKAHLETWMLMLMPREEVGNSPVKVMRLPAENHL